MRICQRRRQQQKHSTAITVKQEAGRTSQPEDYATVLTASRGLLVVPGYRLSSYGRRAFSVAGPAPWNWLSDSLRDPAISRDSFKRSLKTLLFSAYSCA